jgi:hypothetical protein
MRSSAIVLGKRLENESEKIIGVVDKKMVDNGSRPVAEIDSLTAVFRQRFSRYHGKTVERHSDPQS